MEKDSVINVSQKYQTLLPVGKEPKSRRKCGFDWYSLALWINVSLAVYAFFTATYLSDRVQVLETKMAVCEGIVKSDLKLLLLQTSQMMSFNALRYDVIMKRISEEEAGNGEDGDETTEINTGDVNEDPNFLEDIDETSQAYTISYDHTEDNEDETEEENDREEGEDVEDFTEYYRDDIIPQGDGKVKRKREIRDYEGSAEKESRSVASDTDSRDEAASKTSLSERPSQEKTSMESMSTETVPSRKSSEYSSKERFIPATYKMSRKVHPHRKHRKPRIGSAERFYTETHSTTSAPIQVRRSRTKSTQSHDSEKSLWLHSQKFQQYTSAIRDTITKDEALRKGYRKYLEEEIANLEPKESKESKEPKEKVSDDPSYNMITIHFSADTSHYSRERDPHYYGNGRMQIKSEVYKDWKPAHWTQGVGMTKYFNLDQGRVTVSTTGIYLIYAQIQYSNVQEVNGFGVFRNNEVVVQCITTSTHPDKQEIKSNTCGISTTILLQSNDSVCIKDLHHGRYVVLTPEKSYFGLVLLSPFKK